MEVNVEVGQGHLWWISTDLQGQLVDELLITLLLGTKSKGIHNPCRLEGPHVGKRAT